MRKISTQDGYDNNIYIYLVNEEAKYMECSMNKQRLFSATHCYNFTDILSFVSWNLKIFSSTADEL